MVRRGEIYKVRFPDGKFRPGVVVSPDVRNREGVNVILAGCTSQRLDRIYPNEVLLEGSGLPVKTKVQADYIFTIRQFHLKSRIGIVPAPLMPTLNEALRISLDLI
ncbi:type II toxin-antitoxin system PemK/MazF family toxin [bacterium]|nr:type II toxin-antitoxin system PemK/MazF family toxin [bacterium]